MYRNATQKLKETHSEQNCSQECRNNSETMCSIKKNIQLEKKTQSNTEIYK